MRAFVEVVESDGYSAAARKMGRSKALLSKYVRELEDDLGTLLINRTTRQLSLTEAGMRYFDSAKDILQRLEEAHESARQSGSEVSGILRVSAPRSLGGIESMFPIIAFAKAYPEIMIDSELDDRLVDLVEERFDVAIRIGKLENSSLIARKLADNRMVYCASPAFLKTHGTPTAPKDMAVIPAIVDKNWKGRNNWPFTNQDGETTYQSVTAVMEVNDPQLSTRAALADIGVIMVPEFAARKELQSGQLVEILESHAIAGSGIYAVYAQKRHVPAKVRVFLDFMVDWFKKKP